jgi:hypothetical protein
MELRRKWEAPFWASDMNLLRSEMREDSGDDVDARSHRTAKIGNARRLRGGVPIPAERRHHRGEGRSSCPPAGEVPYPTGRRIS